MPVTPYGKYHRSAFQGVGGDISMGKIHFFLKKTYSEVDFPGLGLYANNVNQII